MDVSKIIASCALVVATIYSPIASADLYSFTSTGAVGQYTFEDTGGGLSSITNFSLSYNGLSFSCVSACSTSVIGTSYLVLPSPTATETGAGSKVEIVDPFANPHEWVFDTFLSYVDSGPNAQGIKLGIFDDAILTATLVQQPSAVPVPAAFPLMASGLAAFGFARRRKASA